VVATGFLGGDDDLEGAVEAGGVASLADILPEPSEKTSLKNTETTEKMMSPTVWILFGVREESGSTLPHPYFIGVYTTLDGANAARTAAVSNSTEEHPDSMYYVKETHMDLTYSYAWSTMDD
jgi:hypothetical protein